MKLNKSQIKVLACKIREKQYAELNERIEKEREKLSKKIKKEARAIASHLEKIPNYFRNYCLTGFSGDNLVKEIEEALFRETRDEIYYSGKNKIQKQSEIEDEIILHTIDSNSMDDILKKLGVTI